MMQARENFSILLVDDDSLVVRVLSHMLCGFAPIRFATSGRVAIKLAHECAPDLVLMDVDMPEFSGFEVCKAFKSDPALAEMPIIFITHIDADIDKLCALLDCQNIAAIEEFALLSPSLSELVGAVRFERLRVAIDNLDFQVGAELLREALSVGMRTMGRGALDELRSAAD